MRMYSVNYKCVGSSTCFGWLHPSSGARTTVITASGTGQLGLIPSALVVELSSNSTTRADVSRPGWQVPEAVITVVRVPDEWVSTPETCRAAYRNVINWIQSHLVGQLLNLIHDARTHEYKSDKEVILLRNVWEALASSPSPCHEGVLGNGLSLNLDTRRRWIVRLTSGPLYPLWKAPLVPIEHEAGWAPDASCRNRACNATGFLLLLSPSITAICLRTFSSRVWRSLLMAFRKYSKTCLNRTPYIPETWTKGK